MTPLDTGNAGAAEVPGADAKLTDLVGFIVGKYHADLRRELPRLGRIADNPAVLPDLASPFRGLREELESHMMKEEQVLFPYVERMEALAASGEPLAASPFGSVRAPIGMMEHEHEDATQALARLRRLTGGYTPPADAGDTLHSLYLGLGELEKALQAHIHLENDVLFPRAARLEEELLARPAV
jgi:regulator of cell morphogenesis and NO signaling